MKKKRFSEEQIVGVLREAEKGKSIGEACRLHGVSEQSFYRWRQRYGGMAVADVKRLRELERENGRLKQLAAERDLEIDAMKAGLEIVAFSPDLWRRGWRLYRNRPETCHAAAPTKVLES